MLPFIVALAVLWAVPLGLDLYRPVPADNPLTVEKIALGRRLFFDRRLSRDQTIACASCHDPNGAFSDRRAIAVGVFGRAGRRNTPAIVNRVYGRAFFWDGRVTTLEEQVLRPIQDPVEMDMTPGEASARVGLPRDDIARALASYVRSILSGDSPFDRFLNGGRSALSTREQAGLQVFRRKGNCTACHFGPTFTDEDFHNTGVAWRPAAAGTRHVGGFGDLGLGAVTGRAVDRGAFKTPTLREVARTAPYMHDGSIATLEDVIEFYDRGGRANPQLDASIRPLGLSLDEKRDLAAFLRTLSGTVIEGVTPD